METEREAARPDFGTLILTDGQRRDILCLLDSADDLVRWASVSMPDVERYNCRANAVWALVYWIAGDPTKAKVCMAEFRRAGGTLVCDAFAANPLPGETEGGGNGSVGSEGGGGGVDHG